MDQRSVSAWLLGFFLCIKNHLLDIDIVNGRILDGLASINEVTVSDTSLLAAGKGVVGQQADEEEEPKDDANSAA